MSEWFVTWFDSKYYHELYQHRSTEEAAHFIGQLLKTKLLSNDVSCIDLACGKGRFSKALSPYVKEVVGFDLSKNSIHFANKLGLTNAHFEVLDMRCSLPTKPSDMIFNMFTSFGYFNDEKSNFQVIQNVYDNLKKGGVFVFDYLNCFDIEQNLISTETKSMEMASYRIRRFIEDGFIKKEIQVLPKAESHPQTTTEQIRYYLSSTLKKMLENVGFRVLHHWGDYDLCPFEENKSPRSIFYAIK